jgi:phosphoribosylamine--glycine ligase
MISGVDEAEAHGALVFHAGTARHEGQLVTSGGRVLCVTALGATIAEARSEAYAAADLISWDGARRREDIALAASGDPAAVSAPGRVSRSAR